VETVSRFFERATGVPLKAKFCDDVAEMQITKEDLKKKGEIVMQRRASDLKNAEIHKAMLLKSSTSSNSINHTSISDDEEDVPVQGWLAKKGALKTVWKRRYFRLSAANLLYYEARTKGCAVIERGACHPWRNKRYSVMLREAQEPSTPYHLNEIMAERERREPFMRFCRQIYCDENPMFFIAVENFRRCPDGTDTQQAKAEEIHEEFLKNGANKEISAPPQLRATVRDEITSKQCSSKMFDSLQKIVLSIMRVDLLPQYLEYAAKQLETEDRTVKSSLTDADKRVESCTGCTAKFSLTKWRSFCQHCNEVYCSSCVNKQCALPESFEFKKNSMARVCDMCYGILQPHSRTGSSFTFSSTTRKPLNLAADNEHDRARWTYCIRETLKRSDNLRKPKTAAESSEIVHITYDSSHNIIVPEKKVQEEEEDLHVEGWLWKEDPTTGVWRRRYFVLNGFRLWYYEMALKGSISISKGLGIHASSEKETLSAEVCCCSFYIHMLSFHLPPPGSLLFLHP